MTGRMRLIYFTKIDQELVRKFHMNKIVLSVSLKLKETEKIRN